MTRSLLSGGRFVEATDYRYLNEPPRPLHQRWLRGIFLDVASTPPLPRRGLRSTGTVRQQPQVRRGAEHSEAGWFPSEALQDVALEPPRLLARLAGTPPDSGGEFPSFQIIHSP